MSSVDAEASAVGLEVLRKGGNAADAAVATAAALGVTEPYSAGIGGGGYFVYFDAATGEVTTIDGRETAPAEMPTDAFIDPGDRAAVPVSPQRRVLRPLGRRPGHARHVGGGARPVRHGVAAGHAEAVDPARHTRIQVDETFAQQTAANEARFAAFPDTAELFLPNDDAPVVGSTFRNPDLAKTLRQIALQGTDAFYEGELADEIVDIVQEPRIDRSVSTLPAPRRLS